MLGVYFSGTGNTKHCIEKLTALLDQTAAVIPLESSNIINQIKNNDVVIFGYPVQFSNAPYTVRDFIRKNRGLWSEKKILCVATMGAFSGDGAGCSARLFRKYGAVILGGVHLKMPDSVCDSKLLKKSVEQNREIIRQADKKIENVADTMCYRCISRCPEKAITLLGDEVAEQCRFERYLEG